MDPPRLRKVINKAFNVHGLALELDALEFLVCEFTDAGKTDVATVKPELARLLGRLHESGTVKQSVVSAAVLEPIILNAFDNSGEGRSGVSILSATNMPAPIYDFRRKQFSLKRSFANVEDGVAKTNVFALRYDILLQQAERTEQISLPKSGNDVWNEEKISRGPLLSSIESLSGNPGTKTIFGLLSEINEGKCYLEDKTGHIQLDLSELPSIGKGFIAWNCFAFVKGRYDEDDAVFKVAHLEMPRPEHRESALKSFPNLQEEMLKAASKVNTPDTCSDNIFVFSDVNLDNPSVKTGLEKVFDNFETHKEAHVFVFCGNFSSSERDVAGQGFLGSFRELAVMIEKYKFLAQNALFVIIPGPQDPGCSAALPRPPFVPSLAKLLKSVARNVEIGSSPLRLYVRKKEVVIFRDDLMLKIRRNCCIPPNEKTDARKQLMDTILSQSHLCSLPMMIQPVHWRFWQAMQLYPLPDYLILADNALEQKHLDRNGVLCINPGSFARDRTFMSIDVDEPRDDSVSLMEVP